jgi:hypothetical protein
VQCKISKIVVDEVERSTSYLKPLVLLALTLHCAPAQGYEDRNRGGLILAEKASLLGFEKR